MSKTFYFKIKNENGSSLERIQGENFMDAIREYENKLKDKQKLEDLILVTSELSELSLNQKTYSSDTPLIGSFLQMGQHILSLVHLETHSSEYEYDEIANSKRLTSNSYKRYLAALTLRKNGRYHSAFTYTYELVSQEEQIIELRYLLSNQATFIIWRMKTTKSFYENLKAFVGASSEREESLNLHFGDGQIGYKRHSDYFDYEIFYNPKQTNKRLTIRPFLGRGRQFTNATKTTRAFFSFGQPTANQLDKSLLSGCQSKEIGSTLET